MIGENKRFSKILLAIKMQPEIVEKLDFHRIKIFEQKAIQRSTFNSYGFMAA
jgi:DNA polymerase III psi subunit